MGNLDRVDHVAISVADIAQAADWYTRTFCCRIVYQDPTWALLEFSNVRLALVIPSQHPPHLGLTSPRAETFGALKTHRDGARSCYVQDPSGNTVEVLDEASL